MFALVDCNNFYVSCERVFNPKLWGRPVVVLSNNDGCAISRSAEAKALGIAMGAPMFKFRDLVRREKVQVYSANFVVYGDMSRRVMQTLSAWTSAMEIYSIDEAFLWFGDIASADLTTHASAMRKKVEKDTGIPVSVGVGATKTLAKVATHYAKQSSEGVCVLDDASRCAKALEKLACEKIWGIGKSKTEFLDRHGITNARELRDAPLPWIRKSLSVVTERTVRELRGEPCVLLEEVAPDKQAIATTRTFGREVSALHEVQEAVSAYTSRCAEKLREQESLAGHIRVYIESSPFKKESFYYREAIAAVTPPSSYTPSLVAVAMQLIGALYRKGVLYKSCGVIVYDLCPQSCAPLDLFTPNNNHPRQKRLMEVIDRHNRSTIQGKLQFASEGLGKPWYMKQAHRSPRYTSRWNELLTISS
ncbi:MAG: Y-family DNA polymerase [Methylacidiphilales bacterium]|nr:Y-family DNA polymerase [Candidatus Methylacidiphilales bacterium]